MIALDRGEGERAILGKRGSGAVLLPIALILSKGVMSAQEVGAVLENLEIMRIPRGWYAPENLMSPSQKARVYNVSWLLQPEHFWI